uniref:Uncharacterized protein n=1 Tax=Utricularia reniformis TaxID=192314 RepID=A0A1Y0B1M4_9LAMI|nr:hypothetical protein AEK19_MT1050 [Utricularia reniformis]ART31273.1 hypothetical protein AEK19_MT1050 [Utricularia reniformis]
MKATLFASCEGLSGVYGRSYQSRDEENFRSSTRHDNSICPAPHGLVKGRRDFIFIRGFISFILNSKWLAD